ncbi:MAG: S8 family serine peptidase, partial [Nanoarchaeota archaeon]|nr:S8 family serine peptidase [Nanoarchaeota archaeon]
KVLDRRASGFLSDVIEGLQWAIENDMQVVNMSLGTASDVQSYHDAIITVYNAGITIVAAAGNDGETDGKIYYPAKYPETIAVSATDNTDDLAYFSSYGEEVDLAAPGQAINSTWKGEDYHIGSGTSMATPHVAGTVALILADSNLKCDTDLDESCSPTEVKTRLEATAEWLIGLTSDEQGLGLIDAEAAVSQ